MIAVNMNINMDQDQRVLIQKDQRNQQDQTLRVNQDDEEDIGVDYFILFYILFYILFILYFIFYFLILYI